ncbi:GntR family transcriptional regulator [Paenibacillus massiliensis]|uniref:GntR family transcriptional regulator n=1 Tax=Paenibacillus massiliensis TaxID=225917 RepID=UPI0003652AD2|nr:GntR family transcriptional regulator [Paenibacillus massiliensis]
MFELDVRSRKPIYEQLMDKIRSLIVSRALAPDEQLPSVRVLSSQLTVNPNTIQKAYRELEREGYIYSVPGKGSFVSPLEELPQGVKLEELRGHMLTLMEEAIFLGMTREDLLQLYAEASQLQHGRGKHGD